MGAVRLRRLDGTVLAGHGAVDAGLIGQICLRYAATLSGIVFLGHQLGSFGVWLGGYAYAKTGNYDMVWWLGVVLAVLAALLCLPVREQPVAQPAAA